MVVGLVSVVGSVLVVSVVVRPLEVATLCPLKVATASATTSRGGNLKWLLATSTASFSWLTLGIGLLHGNTHINPKREEGWYCQQGSWYWGGAEESYKCVHQERYSCCTAGSTAAAGSLLIT